MTGSDISDSINRLPGGSLFCVEYMEKIIERGLLFDYYGGLLNEKNRRIYEACAIEDMSLSEISDEMGISRQAVSETLKRIDLKLERYDRELCLIEKSKRINDIASAIEEAVGADMIDRKKIKGLTDQLKEGI